MTTSQVIVTCGLLLDIIGVLLVAFFGLPPKVNPSGEIYIAVETTNEADVAKGKRYRRLQYFGIVLLVAGFGLQLVGNLVR